MIVVICGCRVATCPGSQRRKAKGETPAHQSLIAARRSGAARLTRINTVRAALG